MQQAFSASPRVLIPKMRLSLSIQWATQAFSGPAPMRTGMSKRQRVANMPLRPSPPVSTPERSFCSTQSRPIMQRLSAISLIMPCKTDISSSRYHIINFNSVRAQKRPASVRCKPFSDYFVNYPTVYRMLKQTADSEPPEGDFSLKYPSAELVEPQT